MRKSQTLSPKLEAVLIHLGSRHRLNLTQAVKLPYLVDLVAEHFLGRTITGADHEAWDHGVVTSQAWHCLRKQRSPHFKLSSVPFSEEQRLEVQVDPAQESVLTEDEMRIVEVVGREFSAFGAVELGRLTKMLNPDMREWGTNKKADTGRDAYERLSDGYLAMADQVSSLTLEDLRSQSEEIEQIEDILA